MKEAPPNRIRDFRKSRGLSLEELAFQLGEDVSITTVSRLERGRMQLTQRWLERISAALQVSPIELMSETPADVRLIPLLGSVPAGEPGEAIEDPQGWFPIPAKVSGPKAFALSPKGDSMDRLAAEGEIIVVDPEDLDLVPGRAYVVRNGSGESTFKRYRSDPPRLDPESSNPAHKPILIGREPFVIVGRVVYAAREL